MNDNSDKIKKGLVVIHDPQILYQFIWYYMAYGKESDWTALCLPNFQKKEYMSSYCKKAGIFKEIIATSDISFEMLPFRKKVVILGEMIIFFLTGKQKIYCKKLIGKYVNIDKYDKIVVLTEGGIITGACVGLSGEKDVLIFDDGYKEYKTDRKWTNMLKKEKRNWVAFALSIMGYCGMHAYYPLKTLKNCTKYLIRPEVQDGSAYKAVFKMYDEAVLPMQKCNVIFNRIYPQLDIDRIQNSEAIFFIYSYCQFTTKYEEYEEKLIRYICQNFSNIVVKTHPMDTTEYEFENVDVYEIERTIPGELIVPYLNKKNVYFTYVSSMVFWMINANINFLFFSKLKNNADSDGKELFWKKEYTDIVEQYVPDAEIVYIE